jgi:hypothetical protein
MKRITLVQRIAGATQYWSAGYQKTTTILMPMMLLLISAMSGTAQTIYVLNGINIGGNYGNHVSTIGEYTAAGTAVNTALVTAPGADMESIALAESLTVNGAPGPKLFVTDWNNHVVSVYDAATGALVKGSLVPTLSMPYSVAVFESNLYVNDGGGAIYQCNAATGAGCFPVGNVTFGQFMAAASDGLGGVNLFVTSNNSGSGNPYTGSVALFNISAGTVVTKNASFISGLDYPEGIAVSADGNTLYVASGDATIGEYSAKTPSSPIYASLDSVGAYNTPYGIAVSGTDLFTTLNSIGKVGEFNAGIANDPVNASLITGLSNPTGIAVWNQCVPAPSGLTAWWKLDETTPAATGYADWTGNMPLGWGHNGVPVVPGEVVNAAKFNGATQYIEIPNAPPLNVGPAASNGSGDFSIDAWVKLDACTPNLSCAADYGVRVILEQRTFTTTYTGYSFYLYNQYLGLQLADNGASPGYTNYGASGLVVPADGQWHFVAVSITRPSAAGFSVQFTLDNKPVAEVSSPARMGSLSNSSVARIGMETISNGSVFNGSIDEVEFFNGRAVSSSEWQGIYSAQTYGKCTANFVPQPHVVFSLTSRTGGNLSMAVSNTGIPTATNVTIDSITSISLPTITYDPALFNLPVLVPGGSSVPTGGQGGFNLLFESNGSTSFTSSFSFLITAHAANESPFTQTITVP